MHEEKTKQKVKRTEVRERDKKMNSNFEYYRIFYYVAKYGNLTKAASALQTSQPAVTRTIHKLEAELGCRLFIRSKSGMELTPRGKLSMNMSQQDVHSFSVENKKLQI